MIITRRDFLAGSGALGVIALAAGCAATHGRAMTMTGEQVQQALAGISAAWADGRWDQIAPLVAEDNIVTAKRAFDAIHALPAVKTELTVLPGSVLSRTSSPGQSFEVDGLLAHQVPGADPTPVTCPVRYRCELSAEKTVRIVGLALLPAPWGAPWELHDLVVLTTTHAALLCPSVDAEKIRGYLPGCEAALSQLYVDMGDPGLPMPVVGFAGHHAIKDRFFLSTANPLGDYAGYLGYVASYGAKDEVPRVVVEVLDTNFSDEEFRMALVHESIHRMQASWGALSKVAPWVVEGSATWGCFAGAPPA